MERKELISIIVPAFNAGGYIEKCISSLLNQNFDRFEIIIVDDGSVDDTAQICDEFDRKDSKVRVVHQSNQGAVVARKNGLDIAKGKYVCFVDADDWIEQGMLETLYQMAEDNSADVVVSGTYLDRKGSVSLDPTRNVESGVYHKGDAAISHNIIYSDDYRKRGISSSLWNKLFRKDLVLDVFYGIDDNTRFSEDELCVYGCLLRASTVVVTDQAFYHYCRNENSLTMSSDRLYFLHADLFYDQMKAIIANERESELLTEKLNRYMVEVYLRGINTYKGLELGNVIPLIYPDLSDLIRKPVCRIVLYGASDVGQSYYSSLSHNPFVEIVAWTDKNWSEYIKRGVDLDDINCIKEKEYDYLMICVESEELSVTIKEELVERYSVKPEKIYWKNPIRLVEMI